MLCFPFFPPPRSSTGCTAGGVYLSHSFVLLRVRTVYLSFLSTRYVLPGTIICLSSIQTAAAGFLIYFLASCVFCFFLRFLIVIICLPSDDVMFFFVFSSSCCRCVLAPRVYTLTFRFFCVAHEISLRFRQTLSLRRQARGPNPRPSGVRARHGFASGQRAE